MKLNDSWYLKCRLSLSHRNLISTPFLKDIRMKIPKDKTPFCFTIPFFALLFIFNSSNLFAQFQRSPLVENSGVTSPPSQSDPQATNLKRAIQNLSTAFKNAFDQGNAKAVASFWSPEGEYIDANGLRLVGRPAIEKAYTTYFKKNKNAKIQIAVDSVRQIGNNLAIEEGRTAVTVPESAPDLSQYTATYVRSDGKWKMVSVKESSLTASAVHSGLKDLEWIIGTWVVEDQGLALATHYQWLPGKKFIERTFSTKMNGTTKPMGKQIIGMDPLSGHLMSWTFNSDGSHAVGIWTATDNGWVIESRGVTSNGKITTADNILTKIDNNGCRWQSVNRTVNGVEMPDALEVVSKRK
ncbi:hypothetical protein V144x_40300 [Gimesia aquarii]|uniref:DUF4440 domain-containing protein n=2 Tax=Gimesia aquarii TaxID=2527964 RepID=A0A517VZU1_9PLAN|nr:hypothetical protein V144x_40300 [Gimesia aquarii]